MPRSANKRKRRKYISGKTKMHTVKNQLMVNTLGYIIHKTNHKKGWLCKVKNFKGLLIKQGWFYRLL